MKYLPMIIQIARIIARPYNGQPGNLQRTHERRDYAIPIPEDNVLNSLLENNIDIHALGKIGDIFSGVSFTTSQKIKDNADGYKRSFDWLHSYSKGLFIANYNDFDTKYGHRRNIAGYADALAHANTFCKDFFPQLNQDDLCIITADHGCDPGFTGTDHTREFVPFVAFNSNYNTSQFLENRTTFADLGATIAYNFKTHCPTGTPVKECFDARFDILDTKRCGQPNTAEEILYLINGYVAGEIPEYQISAWLMAVCCQGLNETETIALTECMLNSGDRMNLSNINGYTCDKHSTGGVGDKLSLIIAPLAAACGVLRPCLPVEVLDILVEQLTN